MHICCMLASSFGVLPHWRASRGGRFRWSSLCCAGSALPPRQLGAPVRRWRSGNVADQNEWDARNRALMAAAARTGAFLVDLVPGRSCGTCIMCCKVYAIRELNKRAGQMCVHAERGCGCKIYDNRPDVCRSFYCMWRVDATLGPEWKPETARFVVALDLLVY